MIRLNVFIQVKEEKDRAAVIALAKELVAASLNDEGCIAYDVFESATRPDVLMICETWKGERHWLSIPRQVISLHWFPRLNSWLQ